VAEAAAAHPEWVKATPCPLAAEEVLERVLALMAEADAAAAEVRGAGGCRRRGAGG
jgi:hypothetical protein